MRSKLASYKKMNRTFNAVFLAFLFLSVPSGKSEAKELALTFDDAPLGTTLHFQSEARTEELIRKLKELNVPSVMVFANACKREDSSALIKQLKKYTDAGHVIGNHTCTHPRLDEVGFEAFSKDAAKGDQILSSLLGSKGPGKGQKFFRFPYLNESKDEKLRDQMRVWMSQNQYRNGMVSIDNDDHIFSFKINQAKNQGKKIDYKKIEKLYLDHVIGAVQFYDDLAVKTLGSSPKQVLLLHEMDATVMFIDSLVKELRKQGWKIISIDEAYKDPMYLSAPKNTYAGNGIIAQMAFEKTGEKVGYYQFEAVKGELNRILGLEETKK